MGSPWRVFAGGPIALLCVDYPSSVAGSQALASPFATVSQKVDSTTITVEDYRPSSTFSFPRFDGARLTGFEVHGVAEDKLLARATRVSSS